VSEEEQAAVSEAELQAFVDGTLDPRRHAAIEAWLRANPPDQERVAAYRAQNDALRALFDPVLHEPVPARLQAAARRSRRPPRPGQLAAVAASLIVGIAAGWILRGPTATPVVARTDVTLPQRAALAHVVYTPEVLHPVEVGADQEAHLVKWLSKRLDQPLKAPDLSGLGFRLVGGRLLPGGDRPAGQFMYENTLGRRLTLYVSTDLDGNRETAFRFAQERGASVFYWIDGPLGYALVADMDRGPLLQVAETVYRQISP
jgi:anti-sigma factor RsiW